MLAAAGEGPASLSVVLVDADGAHGNGERTALALTRYRRFRQLWVGGDHGFDRNAADAPLLGRVAVEPLLQQGQWQWTPPPEAPTLASIAGQNTQEFLGTLFYGDAREAGRPIQHGLNGQGHLGAAIFYSHFAQPGNPVTRAIGDGVARGAKVVIVGSAFGGTGVGGALALHRVLTAATGDKAAVAVQWMAPYFDIGQDLAAWALTADTAIKAAEDAGLTIMTHERAAPVPLAHQARGGRAQCNPSMPAELFAAAQLMAFMSGGTKTPYILDRTVLRLQHLIRLSHLNLYEAQIRLRDKARLFSGNWALAHAGKVDGASIGEPVNILSDFSRRVLECAGSVASTGQAVGDPLRLGWRIAPLASHDHGITGAPKQAVQMADPTQISARVRSDSFDALVPQSAPWPHWALVQNSLRRRTPVASTHRGLGRALVAAHRAVAGEGALAI